MYSTRGLLVTGFLICFISTAFAVFADIMDVPTSGASAKTARQDGLPAGVSASHTMAQTDSRRMMRYKSIITDVGQEEGIDPALIAGIISRESRAGNILQDGWGDHGNGWGLMQVDRRYHSPEGEWNSKEHLTQATGILKKYIHRIEKKFPQCTKEQQLKGGIAAYNTGPSRVDSCDNVDAYTTGRDYANDVVARAQWYKTNGY